MSSAAASALATSYQRWSSAARGTAYRNQVRGDTYGVAIAMARAAVYDEATTIVRHLPASEAAAEMMSRARAAHVRMPPLIAYDAAGVQYSTARAWQHCAWQVDPELPEVQPRWD